MQEYRKTVSTYHFLNFIIKWNTMSNETLPKGGPIKLTDYWKINIPILSE